MPPSSARSASSPTPSSAPRDEFEVDVIAVGDHDRGWFSRLMSPSVTTAVTERAHVPVLVIRIPHR